MTFRGEGTSEGRRHGYSLGMFSAFELVEDASRALGSTCCGEGK